MPDGENVPSLVDSFSVTSFGQAIFFPPAFHTEK